MHQLRGKHLLIKPGRSRRYQLPSGAARTITALLTLRAQVIGPMLAGVRNPGAVASPPLDPRRRRLRTLRTGMHSLFDDLGITMYPAAA